MPHGERDLETAFSEAFSDEHGNLLIPAQFREPLVKGLVKAVELATVRAGETLRTLELRREIRLTAATVAVIAAAIAGTTAYVLGKEGSQNNCRLITKIGNVQRERILEAKVSTERFKRESLDRLGLSRKRFDELIKEGEVREARQLRVYEEITHANC